MATDTAPKKWAILIGIDKYRHENANDSRERETTAGKKMIPPKNLGGCVNDVLATREYLLDTMQLTDANIQMLLAPQETNRYGFPLPSDDKYTSPTYDNIVQALADVDRYREGDFVYVHFSGHGARASTVFPEYKQCNDIDYCLLPTDVACDNGKYLRDVELGALLQDIVKKGVALTVVLDCCHSGAAIRGDEDDDTDEDDDSNSTTTTSIRGDIQVYQSVPAVDLPLHQASQESIKRRGNQTNWMQRPDGFVVLAACLDHQKAYETRVGRDILYQQGYLTFSLLDTLRSMPSPLPSLSSPSPELSKNCSADTIYHTVRTTIAIEHPDQTPYLFNDNRLFFFDPKHRARVYAVPVLKASHEIVVLNGGHLHGVHRNSEYVILSRGCPLDQPVAETEILARVRVESLTTDTAKAKVIDARVSMSKIRPGCPAVLQTLPSNARLRVRFDSDDNTQRCRFKDEWEKCSRGKLLELLDNVPVAANTHVAIAGLKYQFTVRIDDQGLLEVTDSLGIMTPGIAKTLDKLPWNEDKGMARLVRRLEHLARFQLVRNLRNPNDDAAMLTNEVITDIQPALEEIDDGVMVYHPVKEMRLQSGTYQVPEFQLFRITVTNRSQSPIGFTILNMQPQFAIDFLSTEVQPFRILESRASWHENYILQIPERLHDVVISSNDTRPLKELFKILVTKPPRDVSSLQLESLWEMEDRNNYYGRGEAEDMDGVPDPLGELLDALEKDTRMTRAPKAKDKGPGNDWVTKDLVFQVIPDPSRWD